MNRIYPKCPQCGSQECGDIACRLKGIKHENAARQVPETVRLGPDGKSPDDVTPADAAPIGYEAAWPR